MKIRFDKYDFYFLLIAILSELSLIYLINGASISYKEALLLEQNKTLIARLANLSIAHFGANDFALKIPNLLFHALNLVLIYLISNRLLKYKRDSVLCVMIYAIIPGVIMQGSILNESVLMLCLVLLICYIELIDKKIAYPFLAIAVFVDKSAFMLFLALFFYALIAQKNIKVFRAKSLYLWYRHFWKPAGAIFRYFCRICIALFALAFCVFYLYDLSQFCQIQGESTAFCKRDKSACERDFIHSPRCG